MLINSVALSYTQVVLIVLLSYYPLKLNTLLSDEAKERVIINSPLTRIKTTTLKTDLLKRRGDPSETSTRMTQVYHNIVKIYTAFSQSEKLPYLVKMLYLFVRSHDSQLFVKRHKRGEAGKGSGKVVLDIPMLSRTFKRSIATIKKNLRLALKLGVFWMLEIKGDEVRLVYTAFTKLCKALSISNLGANYEVNSDESEQVRTLNIRFIVAQKQRNAQQAAIRSTKLNNAKVKGKKLSQRVIKPNRIFEAISTLCDRSKLPQNKKLSSKKTILSKKTTLRASGIKALKRVRGRFLVVNRSFVPYGVSQEAIATLVNRTPQTIRKHLKAINGLPNVDRYQICVPTNDAIKTQEFWLSHNLGEKHYMRFDGDHNLYVATTNIYDLEDDASFLLGCNGLRKRVSQYTRKANSPLSLTE